MSLPARPSRRFATIRTASGDDVVITTRTETGNVHITLQNYLVDHEMGDLTAEDFLFGS